MLLFVRPLARLPVRSEGELSKARFEGTRESSEAGLKSSSEGSDNKGAGEADDIFTVGKLLAMLKAFGLGKFPG